jgi:hypothetical protein
MISEGRHLVYSAAEKVLNALATEYNSTVNESYHRALINEANGVYELVKELIGPAPLYSLSETFAKNIGIN